MFTLMDMAEGTESSLALQGEENFHDLKSIRQHTLLLLFKVLQSIGKPLPVGSYRERLATQMIQRNGRGTPTSGVS